MGVDTIIEDNFWMLEVDMSQLRDTFLVEQQHYINAVKTSQ